jgi:hypothetical protein
MCISSSLGSDARCGRRGGAALAAAPAEERRSLSPCTAASPRFLATGGLRGLGALGALAAMAAQAAARLGATHATEYSGCGEGAGRLEG